MIRADQRVCPNTENEQIQKGEHTGSPLHQIIQWFKTMTTNDYIRGVKQHKYQEFRHRLWQRNYYEYIIRNEEDYNNTKAYISSNPINWESDQLYKYEGL
jgi:REP element-mobilizing transposase RayT